MKGLLLLSLMVGSVFAVPYMTYTQPPTQKLGAVGKPNLELCGLCVSFAGQFIDQLLNIILNAGVVGGCGELCSLLEQKTGSKLAGTVCDLLCDFAGIKEFINLIQKADLDPIYYCELLKACPIKDNGDASILKISVDPPSGPQGQFKISVVFKTINGTGTGETDLAITTVDGLPVGDSELSEPQPPGTYTVDWNLNAQPDPDCDPTQGPCEQWLPGVYNVTVAICNGECGSKHPHSQVYCMGSGSFTLTGAK